MPLPTTTRQYSYPELGSFDYLIIQEVPVSAPKANEVLVKTHAVSLQYRDLMVARRQYPGSLPPNLVPCSDMAGEVIAVGDDVKEWKAGDRVCANFLLDQLHDDSQSEDGLGGTVHGVLTEYRAFPAASLVAIPDHLSYEEASTLPCAAVTAYNALLSGFEPLKAGDTVLVQGTGGVSIFALQFAIASGAIVIATSSSDEKLKTVTKLGAKHVINYKTTPNWAASEPNINSTGGRKFDLTQSIGSAKRGASIDIIGDWLLRMAPAGRHYLPAILRALKIRGIYVGSVVQFKNMNKLMSANAEATRPIIDKVFAFDKAKEAFAYLASQAHIGKVVIKI
ncbi:chaperonin 10-like protein [Mycena leptocephala]|nr:chaperonin 10-like protein [Mycena leptocephala]